MVHFFIAGVASDAFYKQVESLCEGIFDLKSQESERACGTLFQGANNTGCDT